MEINKLVNEGKCLLLKSKTKTESLLEIIDLVASTGDCKDIENLNKEIFYREQIMSTGIGQGIAIPHVRFDGIKEPVVYIGINPSGIKDYESLDGELVKIVVMILVNTNQHKEYLRILSLIVSKLKDREFQEKLLGCKSSIEIAKVMKGEK